VFVQIWQWLYSLPFSGTVRESSWVFPIFECIHLYSMVFLIGLVATFDLRLMGFALENQSVSYYSQLVRRWIWIPFCLNVITGVALFAAKAPEYSQNLAFVTKMFLLGLGVAYHAVVLAKANRWDNLTRLPFGVNILGGVSLALWIGVVAASRWIAYVS
jgi:Family of unknown function (DUF6644)